MRRFVIGDIHGAHRALLQCFERSGFDRQNDLLISLGDLGDGWPDVDKVFDELLRVRNLILIMGNHDQWLLNWFNTGIAEEIWLIQGGRTTIESFKDREIIPYRQLLENAKLYYVLDNKLFVHGGFLTDIPIEQQDKNTLLWDRSLIKIALLKKQLGEEVKLTPYNMVFVGHTPTINFGELKPIVASGVCMMDTGAGWPGGLLSIRDIDNETFFSSDQVKELYRNIPGRKGL